MAHHMNIMIIYYISMSTCTGPMNTNRLARICCSYWLVSVYDYCSVYYYCYV